MAAPIVQTAKGAVGASNATSIPNTVAWGSNPTAGHLLVLIANSGSTITTPSGWTPLQSVVDFMGTYVWTKTATGSESHNPAIALDASASGVYVMYELDSSATAFDVSTHSTNTGTGSTAVTGTTGATTQASETVFVVFGSLGANTSLDSGGVASLNNSFTLLDSFESNASNPSGADWISVGYKNVAATGTQTCTATYTNSTAHSNGIVFTVKTSPSVSVSGVVAPVTVAAPVGTPSGTATVTGPVAPVTALSTPGVPSGGATIAGALSTVAIAAPAGGATGTWQPTVAGPAANVSVAALAGLAGVVTAVAGPVAPVAVSALAGVVNVTNGVPIPGAVATVTVKAWPGVAFTNTSPNLDGPVATVTVIAPDGLAWTGSPLAAATALDEDNMAISAHWFGHGLAHVLDGDAHWTTDTIKATLHTSAYAPDQANDEFYATHWQATELTTGNGYTSGGLALTAKSTAYASGTKRKGYFADPTFWTAPLAQSLTARYVVLRKDTGNPATDIVLGYVDAGQDVTATGAPWTVTWDATNGALYVEVQ